MDRILVVDDSAVVCRVLDDWLQAAGYEVTVANTGEDALREVAANPPSLLLLDIVMPGMSGIDVCRILKGDEATSRIPVVILTGSATTENRIQCLELGAEDFLSKPVIHEELLARVRSLLRAKHLSDRLVISYVELDKLGAFAETFTSQNVADWSAWQVADSMAQQLLGPERERGRHPQVLWAGRRVRHRMVGMVWYHAGGEWRREATTFPVRELAEGLRPFQRQGAFISQGEPPAALCALLHLPASPPPSNFVALWVGDEAVLAAGYPWEVGAFELPLLRSLLRHWSVFECIRAEARQAEKAFFLTMETLALAAEFYDGETARHIRRVGALARMLAQALGCDPSLVKWVSRSAPMHDVGKITIPLELVRKPGVLTPVERSIMERHTSNGARLLGTLAPLQTARNIARAHHENYDGSGYPEGARGTEIPLEARIVKVVDIYDAVRTVRPYKRAYAHEEALAVLRRGEERVSPEHLDPGVLTAFLDIQQEVARVFSTLSAEDGPADPADGG